MSPQYHISWRVASLWMMCWLYVPLAAATECVLYNREPLVLHCGGAFASCNYVSPVNNLSLLAAEDQLGDVIHLAEIAVNRGTLSQTCFDSFVSFYCHQVYALCEQDGAQNYVSTAKGLCQNYCEHVITADCGSQAWSLLGNNIEELRNGIIQTPSLLQNCSTSSNNPDSCVPLLPDTSSCIPTVTPTTQPPTDPISIGLILGICLGVGFPLITVAIIIAIAVICCRTTQTQKKESDDIWYEEINHSAGAAEEGEGADNRSTMRGTLMMRSSLIHGALLDVNLSPRSSTLAKRLGTEDFLKMSPKQRLQALEFPHGNICVTKDGGETNFGKMYIGEATGLMETELSTTVFIKSLRERASSKLRQQFTVEMTWASGFNHPNILSLLAVCTKDNPRYMVFEYLEYGTLKGFLQSIDSAWFDFDEVLNDEASTCASTANPMLGIDDLTGIICQVANGMQYLARKAFVHKDLATRNCHIGQGLRVKIANFGLSHDLHSKDYCSLSSTKTTPLPLRWLAPEALQHNKFSVYSDVWAFGVMSWEVFSFGTQPYPDLLNDQVMACILNHQLLPKPDKCPERIYQVLLKCWSKLPAKRPWFSVLSKELKKALGSLAPEDIKKYGGALSTPELDRRH